MIINKLSTQELQDLIGVSILDRLKDILPSLPESGIENPNDVYEKAFLIKIFLSFQGQDSFLKKNFRMMLLNRLSDDEIKKLAELLELNSNLGFDRLVKDISNINWEHNEQTKRMIKYFNLPIDYLPEPKEELPNVETIKCHERPFKLLKDFQFKVFMNAMTILENPMKRFVIQMPTGSGKTRTAMEIVTSFLIKNPGKSVIWLAHSDELCEQAVECFKDVWMHVGTFDIDIVRAWGKNNLKVQKRSSFVVAGFPKINSILKKNMELIKRFANNNILVIVDEAHKAIARTYKKVIESLVINSSNVPHLIGLTATPGRSDVDSKETKKLIEFFFKDKIEIDSGSKTVFQYLRDKKILSHIENEPISGRRYELSASEKNYIETYFDFPEGFLKRVSDDDVRNVKATVELLEDELSKMYPEIHFVIYDTSDGGNKKIVIEKE